MMHEMGLYKGLVHKSFHSAVGWHKHTMGCRMRLLCGPIWVSLAGCMLSEILTLAHDANALPLADELKLAHSSPKEIICKHWHRPISCTIIYR